MKSRNTTIGLVLLTAVIETTVWPTNADVMPFTVETFAQDYAGSNTPTVFTFTGVSVTNNYVRSSAVPVTLNVAGAPYSVAVLVDDANFSNAVWQTYSSPNVTVNLGYTQGWHEVWIGLRGHADAASAAVWQWKRLKLDTTVPSIVITSPRNFVVDVPMIQLQGYSPEELDQISCDVSNALEVISNLEISTTSRFHDRTTWEFTTNYFECLDLDLANGLNTITVHATDLAGNVTTTNFNYTLDYTRKLPPVITLTWPTNGMEVCGDQFTWDGFVSDPTVKVSGLITNSLSTNLFTGVVERNGRFWVDDLPLGEGTNGLWLTVKDAAGQISTTNIWIVKGSLTLTIDPVMPKSDLWKRKVNVTGTISDSSYRVWVNGRKGSVNATALPNGLYVWSANDVPTTPGGVASFTLIAYAPNEPEPTEQPPP